LRIGALQPIANDNWRLRGLRTFNKARKVGDAELPVTVGVRKVVVSGSGKA
jgi:hypothetical protein